MSKSQHTTYFTSDDIEKTLETAGVLKTDSEYETLVKQLKDLSEGRVNRNKVSAFYTTYSQVMVRKLREKNADIIDLKTELSQADDLIKSSCHRTAERILLNNAITIKDIGTYNIMRMLENGGKNYATLKEKTGLNANELRARIDFLTFFGLTETHTDDNGEICCLSETGKSIIAMRGRDFEKYSEAFINKDYQLALRAVGNDDAAAKRLLAWTEGHNGRKHATKIAKLYKTLQDPRKLSQSFFGYREEGDAQQKHIGIKIADHNAAGELLILKYSLS